MTRVETKWWEPIVATAMILGFFAIILTIIKVWT